MLSNDKYNIWHRTLAESELKSHVLNSPWYKKTLSLIPINFEGKILEIGCGRGDFSIFLAQTFPKSTIIATDFSSFAISNAKQKVEKLPNIKFLVADAENLQFGNKTFDLVISCETLEHVNHQLNMLQEIYRILKPDGQFIVTTENYLNGMILSWLQTWVFKTPFDSGSGAQPNENFMICFATYLKFRKAKFKKIKTTSNHFQWILLPKVNPLKLCTVEFKYKWMNNFFKPFGRHFTYYGNK